MRAAEVIKQTKSTNSIYYPVSSYYDIKKIENERGIFKEIDILYKVLIKETFTRNFYLLKHRFKNFVKKIIKWENQNPKINTLNKFQVKFDENCVINLDTETHKYNQKFSQKDYNFIKKKSLRLSKLLISIQMQILKYF